MFEDLSDLCLGYSLTEHTNTNETIETYDCISDLDDLEGEVTSIHISKGPHGLIIQEF